MSDWFAVEEIGEKSWAISEYQHWEETHCYLLCGTEKALLLDTGLGIDNIRQVVEELTNLPVEVLTTHAHWDHIGGHRYFAHILVHPMEEKWLSGDFPIPLEVVKRNLTLRPCDFPADFDIANYRLYAGGAVGTVEDGSLMDLGSRVLEVLHTPGHSPGHVCLYEREKGWLFSGDLLYMGCLYAFYPTTDPVDFADSVERVAQLPIRRIWPGHHSLDIPKDFVLRVQAAFQELRERAELYHGAGTFDFGDFQIQL